MDTREVPEDERRRQILTYENVRSYLRDQSSENGMTYSQQLDEWLPENWEDTTHEYLDGDVANIKASPVVHEKVDSLTGQRVKPGDTVAFYVLLAAVDNGDIAIAQEIAPAVPNLLWDLLDAEVMIDGE